MPDGDIPFGMSFSIRRFYMICKRVEIDTIPACVWGMASTRVIVAVHGNMASKTDTATAHLAEFAVQAGDVYKRQGSGFCDEEGYQG